MAYVEAREALGISFADIKGAVSNLATSAGGAAAKTADSDTKVRNAVLVGVGVLALALVLAVKSR